MRSTQTDLQATQSRLGLRSTAPSRASIRSVGSASVRSVRYLDEESVGDAKQRTCSKAPLDTGQHTGRASVSSRVSVAKSAASGRTSVSSLGSDKRSKATDSKKKVVVKKIVKKKVEKGAEAEVGEVRQRKTIEVHLKDASRAVSGGGKARRAQAQAAAAAPTEVAMRRTSGSVRRDSVSVRRDSSSVRRDSGSARRDTYDADDGSYEDEEEEEHSPITEEEGEDGAGREDRAVPEGAFRVIHDARLRLTSAMSLRDDDELPVDEDDGPIFGDEDDDALGPDDRRSIEEEPPSPDQPSPDAPSPPPPQPSRRLSNESTTQHQPSRRVSVGISNISNPPSRRASAESAKAPSRRASNGSTAQVQPPSRRTSNESTIRSVAVAPLLVSPTLTRQHFDTTRPSPTPRRASTVDVGVGVGGSLPPSRRPSSASSVPSEHRRRVSKESTTSSVSQSAPATSRAELLRRRNEVRRQAADDSPSRYDVARPLGTQGEEEWMASRAKLIHATLRSLPLDDLLSIKEGDDANQRLHREALQRVLEEGGQSLMHESFHLLVLLRRALADISEREERTREAKSRAESAERKLQDALDELERLRGEAAGLCNSQREMEGSVTDEAQRRRRAEETVAALQAKIEVLVGWARVEEDGRAAAEDRLAQAQHAINQHTHALNDARASVREKEGTIQKLCLDQEALANKCGELAKELQQSLQRATLSDRLVESKQTEVSRMQGMVRQLEQDIEEYKGLLQKNERRSVLLLEQMKKLSDENMQLMRRTADTLGREGEGFTRTSGPDGSTVLSSMGTRRPSHPTEDRQGRVRVLEEELRLVEHRSQELEQRLQQEVRLRGAVGEERDQLRAKLDAALGQLSKSEEVVRAKDQALRALQSLVLQHGEGPQGTHGAAGQRTPSHPSAAHEGSPIMDSGGGSYSSPSRAGYRYFSLLSIPQSPGMAKSA